MIEPIRLAFEVACPAEHAFATWTERTSTWWPASHTVSTADGLEVTFVEVDAGRTRVEIEHRGWERLGAMGVERRDRNRGGWANLLPHYTELANAPISNVAAVGHGTTDGTGGAER